jgi:hypothetical protein
VLGAPESVALQVGGSRPLDSLTALRVQIHNDLRAQHPEWIEPNGECPTCDSYEARLAELLDSYRRTGSDESIAAVHRALQEAAGLNKLPAG